MPLTLAKSGNPFEAIGGDLAIIAAGGLTLFAAMKTRNTRVSQDLRNESLQRDWAWQVRISLVLLLGLSAIAQKTGASTLVAGFVAGMVLVRLHESDRLVVQFTGVANGFFVPLFFVLLGAELNLRALLTSPSRILLALGLAVGAVITHLIAARIAGHEKYLATGMAASAQLGMPAAAASLGLSTGLLSPAEAAALVAGGVLTLIPATIGSLLLARGAAPVGAAPPGSTAKAPI
jgi:Kef-type K+ transport system membrane component KefB